MTNTIDTGAPAGTQAGDMRTFIEAVLGEQSGNVVMSLAGGRLPDGKPIVNRPRWFTYPRDLGRMVTFTEEHAEEDVYLSPIIYGDQRDEKDRLTRAKTNALTAQCIYMDSDACPPEKFRLAPSIHVDTSEGHGHDYWLLAEPVAAQRAADIAHRISTAHKADGTDPSGWSSSKFLRMPTVNRSYEQPWPITWHHSGEVYLDLDVEGAYDDVEVTLGAASIGEVQAANAAPTVVTPASGRRPEVLTGDDIAPLYDRIPASNRKLIDLIEHAAKEGDEGWRSEQRWALLLELTRAGFTEQEALSLAWLTSASGKWHQDARGIEGLWLELVKARATVELETGASIPAAERPKSLTRSRLDVLTEDERHKVADRRDFVQRYVTWAASRVPVLNRPLHEINAWTYLSVVHAQVATVWKQQGALPLNLYSVTIAESSSGKSEAARLMKQALGAVSPNASIEIGADTSRNALVTEMLDRDGEVALATADEADETFRTQRDTAWAAGVTQAWTEMYDGFVPTQNRKGETIRPNVPARLSMHMVGTPEAMFNVLDRPMFKSGYMVRHVWVLGEHIPVTAETIKLARPWDQKVQDATLMPRYWAEQVWRRRISLAANRQGESEVIATEEAYARLDTARLALVRHLDSLNDPEMFTPMGRRMLDVMLKVMGMVALQDDRTVATVRDALVAIQVIEGWVNNALAVVDSIASSAFSRACDEIEAFVRGREGKAVEAQRIFLLMRGSRPRDVEEQLDSLVRQGRLEVVQTQAGGTRKYKVKGE